LLGDINHWQSNGWTSAFATTESHCDCVADAGESRQTEGCGVRGVAGEGTTPGTRGSSPTPGVSRYREKL